MMLREPVLDFGRRQEKGRETRIMTDDFPWQNATPPFLDNEERAFLSSI